MIQSLEIWVINFVSFNTLLVTFQPTYFALYFTTQFITECELMLLLIWTNSTVYRDNKKSHLALAEEIHRYYKSIIM